MRLLCLKYFLLPAFMTGILFLCPILTRAQTQCHTSSGPSIGDLRRLIATPSTTPLYGISAPVIFDFNNEKMIGKFWESKNMQPVLSAVFLPRWQAEDLPVFCKIEHNMARRLPMPFKFRLGSVEYVDWLEGKGSAIEYGR